MSTEEIELTPVDAAIDNGVAPSSAAHEPDGLMMMAHGSHHHQGKKLNHWLLAVLVFYNVSGGPFGVEETVRAGGNFYTLLGFLIGPFIWSIPEAVMTTELGTTFPEPAGGVAWVEEAFGDLAGWMAGYLGWVGGATDNAIYPVLFMDYIILVMFPNMDTEAFNVSYTRFAILLGAALTLGYVNWLGLDLVGRMSIVICCIAMSPFIIASIVGVFQVDPANWFLFRQGEVAEEDLAATSGGFFPNASWGGVLWRPFLNNLFWNLNSFDAAACFTQDVDDLPKTFPRGMAMGTSLVFLGYFVPLVVMLGASKAPSHAWVDGYLATVASEIAGPWLGAWTVFAAGLSNLALFEAELSADSYQIMGMAERGHIPPFFSKRSRHGTPTYGIALGTLVIILMAGFSDLDGLVEMLNFNYALSLLLEYSAFLRLRFKRDDLPRPWKLPLNRHGCVLFFIPPFVFTVVTLCLATYTTLLFSLVMNVFGLLLYRMRTLWKQEVYTAVSPENTASIEAVPLA